MDLHVLATDFIIGLFWSSGIMDCMLFTFENRIPLMRYLGGVSGVASFITADEQLQ